MPKILEVLGIVFKIFFRTFLACFLVFNFLFIISVVDYVRDFDQKISDVDQKIGVITTAFNNYNRIISDRDVLPNFPELAKANIVIYNKTRHCVGAGTTLLISGHYFILSAGHLDDPNDNFYVKDGKNMYPITLIKVNHKIDLALFIYDEDPADIVSAPLATKEPTIGDRVWAIGNPAMLEDAITGGVIMKKNIAHYFIDNKIYYGSSGGGLFNAKGELIGVNVAMACESKIAIGEPQFTIGISVSLVAIYAFLVGDIPSEI